MRNPSVFSYDRWALMVRIARVYERKPFCRMTRRLSYNHTSRPSRRVKDVRENVAVTGAGPGTRAARRIFIKFSVLQKKKNVLKSNAYDERYRLNILHGETPKRAMISQRYKTNE